MNTERERERERGRESGERWGGSTSELVLKVGLVRVKMRENIVNVCERESMSQRLSEYVHERERDLLRERGIMCE